MLEHFSDCVHIWESKDLYRMASNPEGWITEGDRFVWKTLCGEWVFAFWVVSGKRKNRKQVSCAACLLLRMVLDGENASSHSTV